MLLAAGDDASDNQRGCRIDAEVDFAVGAALMPVDRGEPSARSADLEAGGVDDKAAAALRPIRQRHGAPAAAEGGRVGHWQRCQPGELQQRTQKADCLPKR